jgi:hypothetical protein
MELRHFAPKVAQSGAKWRIEDILMAQRTHHDQKARSCRAHLLFNHARKIYRLPPGAYFQIIGGEQLQQSAAKDTPYCCSSSRINLSWNMAVHTAEIRSFAGFFRCAGTKNIASIWRWNEHHPMPLIVGGSTVDAHNALAVDACPARYLSLPFIL